MQDDSIDSVTVYDKPSSPSTLSSSSPAPSILTSTSRSTTSTSSSTTSTSTAKIPTIIIPHKRSTVQIISPFKSAFIESRDIISSEFFPAQDKKQTKNNDVEHSAFYCALCILGLVQSSVPPMPGILWHAEDYLEATTVIESAVLVTRHAIRFPAFLMKLEEMRIQCKSIRDITPEFRKNVCENIKILATNPLAFDSVPLHFVDPRDGFRMFCNKFLQESKISLVNASQDFSIMFWVEFRDPQKKDALTIPYWVFVSVQKDAVHVVPIAKPDSFGELLASIRESVVTINRTVNQLQLLRKMSIQKVLDDRLYPNFSELPRILRIAYGSEKAKSPKRALGCPYVHHFWTHLHDRSDNVLGFLRDFLENGACDVKDFFTFMLNNKIYMCSFKKVQVETQIEQCVLPSVSPIIRPLTASMSTSSSSPFYAGRDQTTPLLCSTATPSLKEPQGTRQDGDQERSKSGPITLIQRYLCACFFGTTPLKADECAKITADITEAIQYSLAKLISVALTTSPSMTLTVSDFLFLRPPDTPPTEELLIELPAVGREFIEYFKHLLLSENFYPVTMPRRPRDFTYSSSSATLDSQEAKPTKIYLGKSSIRSFNMLEQFYRSSGLQSFYTKTQSYIALFELEFSEHPCVSKDPSHTSNTDFLHIFSVKPVSPPRVISEFVLPESSHNEETSQTSQTLHTSQTFQTSQTSQTLHTSQTINSSDISCNSSPSKGSTPISVSSEVKKISSEEDVQAISGGQNDDLNANAQESNAIAKEDRDNSSVLNPRPRDTIQSDCSDLTQSDPNTTECKENRFEGSEINQHNKEEKRDEEKHKDHQHECSENEFIFREFLGRETWSRITQYDTATIVDALLNRSGEFSFTPYKLHADGTAAGEDRAAPASPPTAATESGSPVRMVVPSRCQQSSLLDSVQPADTSGPPPTSYYLHVRVFARYCNPQARKEGISACVQNFVGLVYQNFIETRPEFQATRPSLCDLKERTLLALDFIDQLKFFGSSAVVQEPPALRTKELLFSSRQEHTEQTFERDFTIGPNGTAHELTRAIHQEHTFFSMKLPTLTIPGLIKLMKETFAAVVNQLPWLEPKIFFLSRNAPADAEWTLIGPERVNPAQITFDCGAIHASPEMKSGLMFAIIGSRSAVYQNTEEEEAHEKSVKAYHYTFNKNALRSAYLGIFVTHNNIILRLYNIGKQKLDHIKANVKAFFDWHMTRSTFVNSFVFQKLGLFNFNNAYTTHFNITKYPPTFSQYVEKQRDEKGETVFNGYDQKTQAKTVKSNFRKRLIQMTTHELPPQQQQSASLTHPSPSSQMTDGCLVCAKMLNFTFPEAKDDEVEPYHHNHHHHHHQFQTKVPCCKCSYAFRQSRNFVFIHYINNDTKKEQKIAQQKKEREKETMNTFVYPFLSKYDGFVGIELSRNPFKNHYDVDQILYASNDPFVQAVQQTLNIELFVKSQRTRQWYNAAIRALSKITQSQENPTIPTITPTESGMEGYIALMRHEHSFRVPFLASMMQQRLRSNAVIDSFQLLSTTPVLQQIAQEQTTHNCYTPSKTLRINKIREITDLVFDATATEKLSVDEMMLEFIKIYREYSLKELGMREIQVQSGTGCRKSYYFYQKTDSGILVHRILFTEQLICSDLFVAGAEIFTLSTAKAASKDVVRNFSFKISEIVMHQHIRSFLNDFTIRNLFLNLCPAATLKAANGLKHIPLDTNEVVSILRCLPSETWFNSIPRHIHNTIVAYDVGFNVKLNYYRNINSLFTFLQEHHDEYGLRSLENVGIKYALQYDVPSETAKQLTGTSDEFVVLIFAHKDSFAREKPAAAPRSDAPSDGGASEKCQFHQMAHFKLGDEAYRRFFEEVQASQKGRRSSPQVRLRFTFFAVRCDTAHLFPTTEAKDKVKQEIYSKQTNRVIVSVARKFVDLLTKYIYPRDMLWTVSSDFQKDEEQLTSDGALWTDIFYSLTLCIKRHPFTEYLISCGAFSETSIASVTEPSALFDSHSVSRVFSNLSTFKTLHKNLEAVFKSSCRFFVHKNTHNIVIKDKQSNDMFVHLCFSLDRLPSPDEKRSKLIENAGQMNTFVWTRTLFGARQAHPHSHRELVLTCTKIIYKTMFDEIVSIEVVLNSRSKLKFWW